MDFTEPKPNGFTVYSKSCCPNCKNVKALLKEKNIDFFLIDGDEYLIEHRDQFLSFMKEKTGQEIKKFPMIFHDGKFIGGFNETLKYIDKEFVTFE
jgi:glutaredoxin